MTLILTDWRRHYDSNINENYTDICGRLRAVVSGFVSLCPGQKGYVDWLFTQVESVACISFDVCDYDINPGYWSRRRTAGS